MGNLSDFVEGIVSHLGRSFLLSGFVPMLILVAVNQYILFAPPFLPGAVVWNLFPSLYEPWLGLFSPEMLTTIVMALALAFIVVPLNSLVIKLFEGLLPGMKAILFPFYLAHVGKHRRLYAAIAERRAAMDALSAEAQESGQRDQAKEDSLTVALDDLHSAKEQKEPTQSLPFDRQRLTPTQFGNAWAVMEEYPHARYGIDSMVFWPYLRAVMGSADDKLLAGIDGQKLLIDVTVNLALALGIAAVESLVFAALRLNVTLAGIALLLAVFFWAFYQAAVGYTRSMSVMVGQAFDLHRHKILDAFGLARPADLDAEYWVWSRLSAFVRRGEPFYFDMLERKGDKG